MKHPILIAAAADFTLTVDDRRSMLEIPALSLFWTHSAKTVPRLVTGPRRPGVAREVFRVRYEGAL